MNIIEPYLIQEGRCYILVDENEVGREKNSLRLAIDLAKQKILHIDAQMEALDDESIEYDRLQDTKNDLELLISGFGDRLVDLTNRPAIS